MDNQAASLTVATPDKTRFGHPINFGVAVVTFDLSGLGEAPSLEIKTQLLAGDHNLYPPDGLPKPPAPAPAATDAGNGEPDPVKEYLASIKKLDKDALRAQCKSLELPEAEWGKMGKASLVEYLAAKASEADTEEDETDTDEDGDGDTGNPEGDDATTTGSDTENA
jgi:hypothetical protein